MLAESDAFRRISGIIMLEKLALTNGELRQMVLNTLQTFVTMHAPNHIFLIVHLKKKAIRKMFS
jgi:hypothetical protein